MSFEHSPAMQRRRGAYSVAEFCEAFGLSVPMFYKLLAKREAPDVMKVGVRTLISVEAADRWRRARERATRQLNQQRPIPR
jgi:predicted DNA-binding transcriptional regulator AlpA